jgi:hypothetical protein
MTGLIDSMRNSFSNSMLNLTNHPGQAFARFGAGFTPGGAIAGGLLGAGFDRQNQANGTAPDQIRAQQEAQSPQATDTSVNDRLAASIDSTPLKGPLGQFDSTNGSGAGMTPEQMDQHILNGYTPDLSPSAPGSADPLGLVPDYGSANPSGQADQRGGNLAADRAGSAYNVGSGNQLAGGGYSDLMNGASGQMISDMSASTSGDPQQYVVYHSPTSKSAG